MLTALKSLITWTLSKAIIKRCTASLTWRCITHNNWLQNQCHSTEATLFITVILSKNYIWVWPFMLGFLLSFIVIVVFISFTFKLTYEYIANQEIILFFDHYKTEIKQKHKNLFKNISHAYFFWLDVLCLNFTVKFLDFIFCRWLLWNGR